MRGRPKTALIVLAIGVVLLSIGAAMLALQLLDSSDRERFFDLPPIETTTPSTTSTESPIRVVAVGDIACEPGAKVNRPSGQFAGTCQGKTTAALAASLEPEAVLALGDLQYGNAETRDFERSYDGSWGRFKKLTYPTPGNHEYASLGAKGYFEYFGKRAGPRGGYYSVDIGSWHIISLNSNCGRVRDACGARQQLRWLEKDLAKNDSTCTLAMFHHPRFSSGRHGSYPHTGPIWRALQKADVDVVLGGHDHSYERFSPQLPDGRRSDAGIRQFVVGTGGKSLYGFKRSQSNSVVRYSRGYGVLALDLSPAGYAWKYAAAHDRKVRDAGSATCH